ncbi:MAG: TAT-variant-translocated molybdopterin oxidoreductase, partial [Terriglobales bacterium]
MEETTKSERASKREDVCPGKHLDRATVEQQLAETKGPEYWRSLEELAGSPEFREMMHREFPKGASEWLDAVSRRGFLQLMGASLAMAGMTGCTKMPVEEIVPYVRQPEQVIPGRPQFYATAFTLSGYANPLLVESHLGRPTKIEGNPLHPASLGGTDIFAQASILGMYDPDRLQAVTHLGDVDSWASFNNAIRGPLAIQKALSGAGIRVLTPTISSPTFKDQMQSFLAAYPQAKWHVYEPINRDNVLEGAKLAFGQPVETRYDFSKANVIVSLDADFLYAGFPGNTRYIRDFASKRNPDAEMSRLYVIESTPSSTGVKADHRLPVRASELGGLIPEIQNMMQMQSKFLYTLTSDPKDAKKIAFMNALAADLNRTHGSSVVIAGDHQPPEVHAAAHAMNAVLGNVGKTVFYTDPVSANPINQTDSIKELVSDMRAGKVDLLVIMGGNPVYDAPADLNFADALKSSNVAMRVYLGLYQNETAQLCHWNINEAHYLESWSDTRAYDGTVSLVQPLIAPLYGGKSAHELMSALLGEPDATGYDIVRAYWQKQHTGADFEAWWRKSLNDGFIADTTFAPKQFVSRHFGNDVKPSSELASIVTQNADPNALEINIRRDPSIYDGQFANNGWLQELPKPLSKLTWDNAIQVGPKMAAREGIKSMDVISLEVDGRKVTGPVWIQAGHPDHSVTVHLGYGRRAAG